MKVLQLGKFYPIKGGVEKVMEIFTQGLAERGFASDMLCASHNGETTDIVFSEESRIFVQDSDKAGCDDDLSRDDLPPSAYLFGI